MDPWSDGAATQAKRITDFMHFVGEFSIKVGILHGKCGKEEGRRIGSSPLNMIAVENSQVTGGKRQSRPPVHRAIRGQSSKNAASKLHYK